jgi:maltooligosyltrehalose trehalohydrolase
MLFMGEEWGASTPFLFFSDHRDPRVARATTPGRIHESQEFGWRPEQVPDPQAPETFRRSRLDWSEPRREPHRSLLELHRWLVRRRRSLGGAGLEVAVDEGARTLTMTRGSLRVRCEFDRGAVSLG